MDGLIWCTIIDRLQRRNEVCYQIGSGYGGRLWSVGCVGVGCLGVGLVEVGKSIRIMAFSEACMREVLGISVWTAKYSAGVLVTKSSATFGNVSWGFGLQIFY